MNTNVDLSVRQECEKAAKDLEKLRALAQNPGDQKAIMEAEYEVHLSSRTLCSCFVNAAAWPGAELNAATHKAVGDILRSAVEFVTLDSNCVRSVSRLLRDFNDLVQRFPPCS